MSEDLARCRKAVRIAAALLWADIPSRDMVAATNEQWASAALAANCAVPSAECQSLALEFLQTFEAARAKAAKHFTEQLK